MIRSKLLIWSGSWYASYTCHGPYSTISTTVTTEGHPTTVSVTTSNRLIRRDMSFVNSSGELGSAIKTITGDII